MSLCQCSLDANGKIQAICWGCLQHRLGSVIKVMEQAWWEADGGPAEPFVEEALGLLRKKAEEFTDETRD